VATSPKTSRTIDAGVVPAATLVIARRSRAWAPPKMQRGEDIRYARLRRTKAKVEIARLSRLVRELQSRLAKFVYRNRGKAGACAGPR
jgi:hypothetical protein